MNRPSPRRAARAALRASCATAITSVIAVALLRPAPARAQGDAYTRATDLEQKGDLRGAAAAYRAALRGPNAELALLDYERVCADAGCTDSVVVLVDSLLRARPSWTLGHTVQLRALRMSNRPADARAAFERWAAAEPRSVLPFREYARLLIQAGETATADTVLRRGGAVGGGRELALEVAQQRAAAGQWVPSAESWREALGIQPGLVQAAAFALRPTPPASRAMVIEALMRPPAAAAPRAAAAALSLGWGSATDGWRALAALPPGDSTVSAWRDFGERAEDAAAWSAARDAFTAVARATASPVDYARAASDALAAGDATGALALADAAARDSAGALAVAAVRVRALARLGRAEEAERAAAVAGASLGADAQAALAREAALGWVRRGDVARARAALARAGGDDDVAGLLAVYDGDLASARPLLKRPADPTPDVVLALAVLGRTTAPRAPGVGRAFLLLARGDTAGAAGAFESAASEVGDAAPALVLAAARLHAATGASDAAARAWDRVLRDYPASPEAPEADLAWGQALARRGDAAAAVARFEHLILTYPESALAPQARAARAALPTSRAGA